MKRTRMVLAALSLATACRPPSAPPESSGETEVSGPGSKAPEPRFSPPPKTPVSVPGDATLTRFELRFPNLAHRRIQVRAVYPTSGRASLTLAMPVWIPGSYLLREYAQNVIAPAARTPSGAPLSLEKVSKNRLQIQTEGASHVVLEYAYFANELTVRTSYVDPSFAVLNPTSLFFEDTDGAPGQLEVRIFRPKSWPRAFAPLTPVANTSTAVSAFVADSFATLVDSPMLAGDLHVEGFVTDEVPHDVVHAGDLRRFPLEQATKDLEKVAAEQAEMWEGFPYPRYAFMGVLDPESGGGLEHLESTLVMFPPDKALDPEGWRRWLGLLSHELFHAWNGKRLRPEVLGPFDLEKEAYTESLWVVEGLTSYYDDLVLRRAGLHDDDSYLGALSKSAASLAGTPGEERQSLARSSWDAWIEYYRKDADTPNTAVSYYIKGSLVGWLIDAEIRDATGGDKSLDDVMRAAYAKYSGERGYPDRAIYPIIEEVGGAKARAVAEQLTLEPGRLDLSRALEVFGLKLEVPEDEPLEGLAARARAAEKTWFGAHLGTHDGRVIADAVIEGGPAWAAGVAPGDEIIALGGDRVGSDLVSVLQRHLPGEKLELWVGRRGRVQVLELTVGERPVSPKIVIDPDASLEAQTQRARWLHAPLPTVATASTATVAG